MKSYKLYLYLFLLLIPVCTGCESVLDLYPETVMTQGVYYNSEAEFILAANDIYRQMGRVYNDGCVADLYGELFSDNTVVIFQVGNNTWGEDISRFRIKTDNGKIRTAWQTAYNAIFIANNIIDQLDNTNIQFSTPELKQRLRTEALFVRSIIFFNLVQAFGDIPLPLTAASPDESYNYLRVDKNTVFQQIINDLKSCKDILPLAHTGNNIGRVTSYAASAFLAKTYLLTGDKSSAQTELKRIIDSGLFSLDANNNGTIDQADYTYLFHQNTKNCKESIFEIQYLAGINQANSGHQDAYTPYYWSFHLPGSTQTFRGEGMNSPSADLIAEYEPDDPRKDISLQIGYWELGDNEIYVDYPFTMKFYDPNWQYPGQNFEAIRYADILLLYSEVTNDPAYLNQVRARVGLSAYGSEGYPSEFNTLEKAIEHERRVELAFEFHRTFDLVRTGRALTVLNSKGFDLSANSLLFPIPQIEIDINPELTQNEAYR